MNLIKVFWGHAGNAFFLKHQSCSWVLFIFFYPEYCENFGFIQMDSLTLSGYKMDFPKAVHDWFSFDFS